MTPTYYKTSSILININRTFGMKHLRNWKRVVNPMVLVRSDNIVHVPNKVMHMNIAQSLNLNCDRNLSMIGMFAKSL